MSSPESKANDAHCTRCGSIEGLQARFLGVGDTSAILCEECQEEFDLRRKLDAQTFIGNETIQAGVSQILQGINEMYDMDLEQEDLKQTPARVSRMFAELCWGYSVDPAKYLKVRYPAKAQPGLVKIGPINFTSMCVHHLAVISGRAYVGYVPGEWIVGLSKIPRVILAYTKRLQLQEYMTYEIIECLQKGLEPQGLMVVVDARHDCMCKRGVSSSSAWTTTSEVRGVFFEDDRHTKEEFLAFMQMHGTTMNE